MFKKILAIGLVVLVASTIVTADDSSKKSNSQNAQFEKLKKLAGTWVEADQEGKPTDKVISIIRLTAGGSAVHETLFPGDDMEMVSVYHLDKGELLMTHYCMLGNQPRMKADPSSPANQIRWQFTGGTNLDVSKDAHMHAATLTFVDNDHIEVVGESWEAGKPSPEHCGKLTLVRKKQ